MVVPPLPLGGGLFYTDVSGIDKIRIDLEEAGRRLLQNYSEKSTNGENIKLKPFWPKVIHPMLSLERQMQKVLT